MNFEMSKPYKHFAERKCLKKIYKPQNKPIHPIETYGFKQNREKYRNISDEKRHWCEWDRRLLNYVSGSDQILALKTLTAHYFQHVVSGLFTKPPLPHLVYEIITGQKVHLSGKKSDRRGEKYKEGHAGIVQVWKIPQTWIIWWLCVDIDFVLERKGGAEEVSTFISCQWCLRKCLDICPEQTA